MTPQQTVSLVSPGFFGLNLQQSPVGQNPSYALIADNCVIDKSGRISSRKGWTQQTTSGSTALSDTYVQFLHEHVNADNTSTILSGGNSKLFTGGVGAALTDITPGSYTVSGNNWKAASLSDFCLLVQDGQEPIVYSGSISPVAQAYTTYIADTPNFDGNTLRDVIAAYGRFWAHDGEYVYWSTDILDSAFPAFSGGSSGFLNINSVLPNNTDTIVALAAHNNFLIIFCQRSIVIYQGADNVLAETFRVNDVVAGTGCIARDSVQSTGNDLIFLSDMGLRSLGRTIQEKSMPMRELTTNVRDSFLSFVTTEIANVGSADNIKSVYSEKFAFYMISFPSLNYCTVLDMRQALPDGSARVTTWTGYPVNAVIRTRDRDLLLGKLNGIGKYEGYTDNGSNYLMRFYTNYIDFGQPTLLKIPKKIKATIAGGATQKFVIKLSYDYIGSTYSFPFTIPDNGPYEYNVDEYMDAEYTAGLAIDIINTPARGNGNLIQLGFESRINGAPISVQKVDLFITTGKNT